MPDIEPNFEKSGLSRFNHASLNPDLICFDMNSSTCYDALIWTILQCSSQFIFAKCENKCYKMLIWCLASWKQFWTVYMGRLASMYMFKYKQTWSTHHSSSLGKKCYKMLTPFFMSCFHVYNVVCCDHWYFFFFLSCIFFLTYSWGL